MLTLNQFKTQVITQDFSGRMSDITDAQFVVALNMAINNKINEVKKDAPDTYFGTSTLTFATDSYTATLPSDIDPNISKEVLVYQDMNKNRSTLLPRQMWRREGSTLRFEYQQLAGKEYYLEYSKIFSPYESTNMSIDVTETINPRTADYLAAEIRRFWYDGQTNAEASAAGSNMLGISNRLS